MAERQPGARVTQWWWDQGGIDLDLGGGRTAARSREVEVEAGMESGSETEMDNRRGEVE